SWQHTETVIGAKVFFGGGSTFHAPNRGAGQKAWGFSATASEDANYSATLVQVKGPTGDSPTTVDQATGLIHAYYTPAIKLQTASHPAGYYMLKLTLTAAVNPARTTTFTSNVFKLGTPLSVAGTRKVVTAPHGHHGKPKKTKHHH